MAYSRDCSGLALAVGGLSHLVVKSKTWVGLTRRTRGEKLNPCNCIDTEEQERLITGDEAAAVKVRSQTVAMEMKEVLE